MHREDVNEPSVSVLSLDGHRLASHCPGEEEPPDRKERTIGVPCSREYRTLPAPSVPSRYPPCPVDRLPNAFTLRAVRGPFAASHSPGNFRTAPRG